MPEIRFQLLPLAVNLIISGLFLCTLVPGKMPLITAIATVEQGGNLPADLARYTRSLTAVWGCFLLLLGVSQSAMTWPSAWRGYEFTSLFADSLAIILFFLLEFVWRRFRFPAYRFDSPWQLWKLIRDQGGMYRLYRKCMS
jgi:uncharacterized membrane protein